MAKYYTGVGSRETPDDVLALMKEIAVKLAYEGYVLRSGGAPGADSAFEQGCDEVLGEKRIYLPWRGFNGRDSRHYRICNSALAMAEHFHPAWKNLTQGARKLHARNIYQVLGYSLESKSEFVVCWTPNGVAKGGTRTAILVAEKEKIDVFNLFKPSHRKYWKDKLNGS